MRQTWRLMAPAGPLTRAIDHPISTLINDLNICDLETQRVFLMISFN